MGFASILLCSVGLAMDLAAVSAVRGSATPQPLPGTPSQTSPDVLKGKLENGERILAIDVRSNPGFNPDSVPGALHIPMTQLAARLKDLPKDVQLVFISNGGGRSSRAARLANRRGFPMASFCALNDWKASGYATEPMREAPPGRIQLR